MNPHIPDGEAEGDVYGGLYRTMVGMYRDVVLVAAAEFKMRVLDPCQDTCN